MLIFTTTIVGLFLYILIGCIVARIRNIIIKDEVDKDREVLICFWPFFVMVGTVYFTVCGMYLAAEWCVHNAGSVTLKYFSRRKRDGGRHPCS